MAVVNNLKEIRKERSLNQKDLAEAAGTCERTISRIERCERNPSLEMALRLSAYLGLAVEEVFSYEKPSSLRTRIISPTLSNAVFLIKQFSSNIP